MIINIRGTHASGKSFLVRELITRFKGRPVFGELGVKRPEAYQLNLPNKAYVLGPYNVDEGGGPDSLRAKGYDFVLDLLKRYADKGNVVFECLVASTSYGRAGELMAKYDARLIWLNTPLDVCLARLAARKLRRVGEGDINREYMTDKYEEIERSRNKIMPNVNGYYLDADAAKKRIEAWLSAD